VRFSARGVQKHYKKVVGKSMSKTFTKRLRGEKHFPPIFFPSILLIEFWLFLCLRCSKTPQNVKKKSPMKSQIISKKNAGR
jgi:hypothetical protein